MPLHTGRAVGTRSHPGRHDTRAQGAVEGPARLIHHYSSDVGRDVSLAGNKTVGREAWRVGAEPPGRRWSPRRVTEADVERPDTPVDVSDARKSQQGVGGLP